jgi:hypothetical protein
MIALLYEDRPAALTGVKLAALSLRRHHPELPLWILAPGAPRSFTSWAERIPGLRLDTEPVGLVGRGWNVKPTALMAALEQGHAQVLWVDSDIVVTGDLAGRIARMDPRALTVTEEYFWGHCQGGPSRTLGLGLEVGRTFATTLNTGIVRVTPEHRELLAAWNEVLTGRDYLEAQRLPVATRPLHHFGDQEVLTGLLGAKAFAHLPVESLRRGRDIAQCFGPSGFTPAERVRCGRSLPLAVHAMGPKPWMRRVGGPKPAGSRLLRYYERVHLELTPYVGAARVFREELEEDTGWMDPQTVLGRTLHRIIGVPALEELPLAVLDSLQRRLRRLARIRQLQPGP